MKERPILFSAESVRAILDGRKTQTRRVVKIAHSAQPLYQLTLKDNGLWSDTHCEPVGCPYGQPGDRLWVRETWRVNRDYDGLSPRLVQIALGGDYYMMADYKNGRDEQFWGRWRSPLFMPRWASRIALEVTGVRVERLQEISEEDVIAEGMYQRGAWWNAGPDWEGDGVGETATEAYSIIWDAINSRRGYPWESNPWVWVVEFRVLP